MKRLATYLLILVLLIPVLSQAQRWKRTRYEAVIGLGLSNMMGDLGGANKDAIYLIDYDLFATRFGLNLGIRYKIVERVAVRFNLLPALLSGSDSYTKGPRMARGISANTFIFETSLQFEYSLIKERLSSRYTFRNMRDFKLRNVNTYLLAGVGGFYMKPKVTGDVTAVAAPFQLAIPFGIGFKYGINRRYAINLEYGMRKTFTDGVDGIDRPYSGNKYKDLYSFLIISVSYKMRTTRSGLPRF